MFGILRPGSPERERLPISPATSPPPPKSMAPIPPGQYNSREELLAHAKDWAAEQGYAIVIARSRFNRLWLKCDRGGKYENRRNLTPIQRKRKRSDSRLLGCPFRVLAVVRKDGVWKVQVEIGEHNHGPSDDLTQHPTLRRLTEDQSQKVNEMMEAGNTPAETLEELRRMWPNIKVITRDVYNARKKYKVQKDLAEQASGLPPEPSYEDPNGTFPGPTPNGRWEWVPDGEEVTSSSKQRRRRRPPVPQESLDPGLQTPSASRVYQFLPQRTPNQLYPTTHTVPQQSNPQIQQRPASLQPLNPLPPSNENLTVSPNQHYTHLPRPQQNQTQQPPQLNPCAADTEPMVPIPTNYTDTTTPNPPPSQQLSNSGNGAVPKAQSGQVIMSRIERMEKEQRDQKSMLQQILASVQGMQGVGGK